MTDKPYVAHIGWGRAPDTDAESMEYRFATEAELHAFFLGIGEMDGWEGYEVLEGPSVFRDDGEWHGANEIECPHCGWWGDPDEVTARACCGGLDEDTEQ